MQTPTITLDGGITMSKARKKTKKELEQERETVEKIFNDAGLHANLDEIGFEEAYDLKVVEDPTKLSYEDKLTRTKMNIMETVEQFGLPQSYLSFSGGKDSSVLRHLAHEIYPELRLVFANTGLELPEIVDFVKKQRDTYGRNVTIVRPRKNFVSVLKEYGFPIIGKEQSMAISRYQNTKREDQRVYRMTGVKADGTTGKAGVISKKWQYLVDKIKTTERCCHYFKKQPFKDFERDLRKELKLSKEDKIVNFAGTRLEESNLRLRDFLKYGCQAFTKATPQSRPIMFWTEEDVNRYIEENNVEICEVYYDKWEVNPVTGEEILIPAELRTGCIFCMYGVHLEDQKNTRFHKLQKRHPKLFKYAMDKLGLREVLKLYSDLEFDDDPNKKK
ncbi:phosphoadenosine phosphosulfate reductase family protein [bacterium]|nr:phosphoadenosine phosphosulfate reductase family protein [bacterium]